jgi:hypothetical protein
MSKRSRTFWERLAIWTKINDKKLQEFSRILPSYKLFQQNYSTLDRKIWISVLCSVHSAFPWTPHHLLPVCPESLDHWDILKECDCSTYRFPYSTDQMSEHTMRIHDSWIKYFRILCTWRLFWRMIDPCPRGNSLLCRALDIYKWEGSAYTLNTHLERDVN